MSAAQPESQPDEGNYQTDDNKMEPKTKLMDQLIYSDEGFEMMITNMPNAAHKRYLYLVNIALSFNEDLRAILSNPPPVLLSIRSQELLTQMPYILYIITIFGRKIQRRAVGISSSSKNETSSASDSEASLELPNPPATEIRTPPHIRQPVMKLFEGN